MNWRATMFFGLRDTLTAEQEIYLDSIFDNRLTIANCPSGTGKTTLAVAAAKLLGKPLYYLFSPVEERRMGYRKGDQADKENDYLSPLADALLVIGENPGKVIAQDLATACKGAWVIAKSHTFLRGTNLEGAFVLIDEAQNWERHELKKTLTRIHDNCTVVIIGHMGQCDLPRPELSGFPRVIEWLGSRPYARVCKLTTNFRGELARDADEL